jgi:hypothetical protein
MTILENASVRCQSPGKDLCSSVEVFVVQTMSYINYELDLGGPGLGHSDTSCDVITMPLRDPRG